ncbi:hypothetical protein SBV1_1530028 [Verrucomicrobia bacterium]|nr:hypothetical protein SBV1_1530028 [Verrucomicrobiota bacterium]
MASIKNNFRLEPRRCRYVPSVWWPALTPRFQRLFCLLILALLGAARGELVLTNYSATHPIKIMPIGDSITDDCEVNGAWRAYLQPLLTSNGFHFTFVGRQSSAPSGQFTQTHHEGYCGAVVAPPGVFAAHQYSTTNNYLLKIVADALAVTNNRPDVALVLIGANDIGRGRDPYHVATNDMPELLDLIFSNVPNANVILAKITSLQSATIINYGAYATNVPIYNAALQAVVNQRRALGQNVFLSDMFSVVDYNTMFVSDHVHPNAAGLKAIAAEWLARIQAISSGTNQLTSTLIRGGDNWAYSDAGQDLGTNWAQFGFDDSGWSNGLARLGYGDLTDATTVNFGADPSNKFITTYFRDSFVVPWNAAITNLNVRLEETGGAVMWLNGQEIFRTNLPAGPIAYTNLALNAVTGYAAYIFYPTNLAAVIVPATTNVVAVEVHQSSPTNSSLGFDMELLGYGSVIPPPSLVVSLTGNNILLSWPAAYGSTFALYSTTNLPATSGWTRSAASVQTNGGQLVVTQVPEATAQYFRLQQP